MKKVYEAPLLEVEAYELNASIANHCGIVVSNGPALGDHVQCDDYHDPFETSAASTYGLKKNVQFYDDDTCDCYTTGGDYGYWTS